MNHKTIFSLITILMVLSSTASLQAEIERRGAFDIGSGSIKLLVADVDLDTQQIVTYIYGDTLKVPFSSSLANSPDGCFGKEVQEQAKAALATLMQRVEIYHVHRFVGIATEAFRQSKNGQQLATAITAGLGVPIFVIPQSEEGELGFESAVAHSKGDPEHAVVWDIGSGSFQISWKELNEIHSYTGKLGKVPTKNMIISNQGKVLTDTTSPNPISQEDADLAKLTLVQKLQPVPANLKNKLQDPETQVYGIGAIHHPNLAASIGKPSYTLPMVEALLKSRLGYDDKYFGEFLTAQYWVSDLIFISSLMSYLNIETVLDVQSFDVPNVPVSGNTVGILLRPKYWQ